MSPLRESEKLNPSKQSKNCPSCGLAVADNWRSRCPSCLACLIDGPSCGECWGGCVRVIENRGKE